VTTILADAKLGVMVSDSAFSDGTRIWSGRKVYRIRDNLVGLGGAVPEFESFLAWYRGGEKGDPEFEFGESKALILTAKGLFIFDENGKRPQRVAGGREAIGTGAMAAISAHEALGWQDPRRAVRIACKHDSNSRSPVRVYRL
jgi:hypothetical protein